MKEEITPPACPPVPPASVARPLSRDPPAKPPPARSSIELSSPRPRQRRRRAPSRAASRARVRREGAEGRRPYPPDTEPRVRPLPPAFPAGSVVGGAAPPLLVAGVVVAPRVTRRPRGGGDDDDERARTRTAERARQGAGQLACDGRCLLSSPGHRNDPDAPCCHPTGDLGYAN